MGDSFSKGFGAALVRLHDGHWRGIRSVLIKQKCGLFCVIAELL